MEGNDELNLLSVHFNADLAINNLESVFLPEHTIPLDNISKAALLLPFGIQKKLKIFDKPSSCSTEGFNGEDSNKDEDSMRKQLNVIRNIEFKLNLKRKFSNKKKKFTHVSNVLSSKFSILPKNRFPHTEEKENVCYNYLAGKEVSCFSPLMAILTGPSPTVFWRNRM